MVPTKASQARYFELKLITVLLLHLSKYLKDPAQPILEALDDSSPKEDSWDSVSIVSFTEKE